MVDSIEMSDEIQFQKGKAASIAGNLEDSRKYLTNISSTKPRHSATLYLARAEFENGDIEASRNILDKYIDAHPLHVGARCLSGRIYQKQKKYSEAKNEYDTALLIDTDSQLAKKLITGLEDEARTSTAIELVNQIDDYFKNNGREIEKNVLNLAKKLSQIKPGNMWNNDPLEAKIAYFYFCESLEHALLNYDPRLLEISVEFNYLTWPRRIQKYVKGKDVIDIGCGFGGYGTGFISAGAKSYVGLDPMMDLDSTRAKNKRTRKWDDMGITPREIEAQSADIRLFQGTSEDLSLDDKFDTISLHNVTEHLMNLDLVFEGLVKLCHEKTNIVFMHHNYYCWNGHHMMPNQPAQIIQGDPKHEMFLDWAHIELPDTLPDDHYIMTSLNRVTLDEMKAVTEKYFDITIWDEMNSNKETAARLTPNRLKKIQKYRPDLQDRDLLTNLVFCVGNVKQ